MAISLEILCRQCKQNKYVYCSPNAHPTICDTCLSASNKAVRDDALALMASKPLEERIAAIEAWMYDHSKVDHSRSTRDMRF